MVISEPFISPYNEKNKLITDNELKKIFSKFSIKIEVKDISL